MWSFTTEGSQVRWLVRGRGSKTGGRTASSHLLSLRHTQEGEFVPLGDPWTSLAVTWPMVHSPPIGAFSFCIYAGSSVHPALTLALLWGARDAFSFCCFVPLKYSFWFYSQVPGSFPTGLPYSNPQCVLCPALAVSHEVVRYWPEGKVWLASRGNQTSTVNFHILHIKPCLPSIIPLCPVGKAALTAGILCD